MGNSSHSKSTLDLECNSQESEERREYDKAKYDGGIEGELISLFFLWACSPLLSIEIDC